MCSESYVVRLGFKLRLIMACSQSLLSDCWTIPLEDVPQFSKQTEKRLKEVREELQALESSESDANLELQHTQLEEKNLLRVLAYCSCRLKEEQIKELAQSMRDQSLSPRDAEQVAQLMRVMRAEELGKTATQYQHTLTDMSESEDEKEIKDRKRGRTLRNMSRRKRARTLTDKFECEEDKEIEDRKGAPQKPQ